MVRDIYWLYLQLQNANHVIDSNVTIVHSANNMANAAEAKNQNASFTPGKGSNKNDPL